MAAPFPVTLNGFGLELGGLAWNPSQLGGSTFIVDGLGLVTDGFIWNLSNAWYSCYTPQAVVWSGCTGCPSPCT